MSQPPRVHTVGPGAGGSKARSEAAKQQRHDNFVQLHKDKRRATQAKRRRVENPQNLQDAAPQGVPEDEARAKLEALRKSPLGKRAAPLRALRHVLSDLEGNTDTILRLDPEFVSVLVECLQSGGAEEKLEAAWCVTNIAAGSHAHTVAALPAVPMLTALLRSPDSAVQEQCLWALSNIAGDKDQAITDALVGVHGVLPPMIFCLASGNTAVSQCAAWALSNTLRGRSALFPELLADASPAALTPTLQRFFNINRPVAQQEGYRIEILWLLAYLTNSPAHVNQTLVQLGLLPFITQTLSIHFQGGFSDEVVVPCVRVVGNVSSCDETIATQICRSHQQLCLLLLSTLENPRKVITKEACWALSNLTAGTDEDIAVFAAEQTFLPRLVHLLTHAEFEVKKEAAFCVANFCSNGRQVDKIVKAGAVPAFLALLRSSDVELVEVSLAMVEMVLECHGGGVSLVEELDGQEAIEGLLYHQTLGQHATRIVDKYFGTFDGNDQ